MHNGSASAGHLRVLAGGMQIGNPRLPQKPNECERLFLEYTSFYIHGTFGPTRLEACIQHILQFDFHEWITSTSASRLFVSAGQDISSQFINLLFCPAAPCFYYLRPGLRSFTVLENCFGGSGEPTSQGYVCLTMRGWKTLLCRTLGKSNL